MEQIIDPKFKTNTLKVYLLQNLKRETASACTLASDYIVNSSQAYPKAELINRVLARLYGADMCCSSSRIGDLQQITFTCTAIADRYALEGEKIFSELTDLLLDCLTHPNLEGDGFAKEEFLISQQELIDSIDAELNDKRGYAIRQASKVAFTGEPAALSAYGTKEDAMAITPVSAYKAFQKMLQTAKVSTYFVGPEKIDGLEEKIDGFFANLPGRAVEEVNYKSHSTIKSTTAEKVEAMPVGQCKLVMALKTTEENIHLNKMVSLILGGTPNSKLFANVREKMSLCYYCASQYSESKYTMLIDSGVELENIEKTRTAILAELEKMKNGEISDEEMESARMTLHNSLGSYGSTPSSYISWKYTQDMRGKTLTPADTEKIYYAFTKEQIMQAAAKFQLDTVYVLKAETPGEEA